MAPSDSGHQLGLTTILMDVLTVDEGSGDGDLKIAISDTFLNIVEHTVEIWSNGWRHRIQHRIGIKTLWKLVQIAQKGRSGWGYLKLRN